MAKQLLHHYTFTPSTNTIVIDGIYARERFLLITNAQSEQQIYVFNDGYNGMSNITFDYPNEKTTIVLDYDCSAMSSGDKLQIFIEQDYQTFEPSPTYSDPVSKFRVSQPENLIDTDFEYGLQSTKWETLEQVRNIPTFYSRNGDQDLDLGDVTSTTGSSIVVVTTLEAHGLSVGNPILVQGTKAVNANGAFVVTKVVSSLSFQYIAKDVLPSTASILDTYTQIFIASVYQGTEFQLSDLGSITTDNANPSTLTVSTKSPTNFSVGTSFFLSNSLGTKTISFDATAVQPANTARANLITEVMSAGAYVPTGENDGWALGPVQMANWRPYIGTFFTSDDITVNTGTNTITLAGHGLVDGQTYVYLVQTGNTPIGGLSDAGTYYAKVISADEFSLSLTAGGADVSLTSGGVNGNQMKSCFAYVEVVSSIDDTTDVVTTAKALPTSDSADYAYMAVTSAVGGMTVITDAEQLNTGSVGDGSALYATSTGTNTYTFQTTFGGSNFDFTSTTATGFLMPVFYDPLANTIWVQGHGFSSGDRLFMWGVGNTTNTTAVFPNTISTSGLSGGNSTVLGFHAYAIRANADRFAVQLSGVDPVAYTGTPVNLTGTINTGSHTYITWSFLENTFIRYSDRTGETGNWNVGSWDPNNWLPEDAYFFETGAGAPLEFRTIIDSVNDTITTPTPHGFEDGTCVVYFAAVNNPVIGGLSDGQYYYLRKIDDYSFYLASTPTSTGRYQISGASNTPILRSCFAKAYQATSNSTTANYFYFPYINSIDQWLDPNSRYMLTTGTMGGLTVFFNSSYLTQNYQTYYPTRYTGNNYWRFGTFPGATSALSTSNTFGAVVKVSVNPNANTVWVAGHKLQTGHMVYPYLTANPSGWSTSWKSVETVGENRLRFIPYNSNGTESYTSTPLSNGYLHFTNAVAATEEGDYINAVDHGLSDGDIVSYRPLGNNPIPGLVASQPYYVVNATANRFQLATTPTGLDGNSVTIPHNTGYHNYFQGYVYLPGITNVSEGDRIRYTSDTPLPGLRNGAIYYAGRVNSPYIYPTLTPRYYMGSSAYSYNWPHGMKITARNSAGSGTWQKSTVVDLLSTGAGTQNMEALAPGAADGVYTITSNVDSATFEMAATTYIPQRDLVFSPATSVNLQENALLYLKHGFVDAQPVTYTATTPISPLATATVYYVIRVSEDWFRLALTADDAVNGVAIALASAPDEDQSLTTSTIAGDVTGSGTVDLASGSVVVTGVGTNFTSFFKNGDSISFLVAPTTVTGVITSVNTAANTLYSFNNGFSTGDMIVYSAPTPIQPLVDGRFYYVRLVDANYFTLHPTFADAEANTNVIDITTAGVGNTWTRYSSIGAVYEHVIAYVNSAGKLELTEAAAVSVSGAKFALGTSLLIRADGSALHRPYDGGVELIPSKNPDSQMIRQTRRYFRYQSGKGIQVSYAVNFQPSTPVENMSSVGTVATVTTRYPHRLDPGLVVVMSGALTTSSVDYWNGEHEVLSVVDEFTFTMQLAGAPDSDANSGPNGIPEFYVQSWTNSALRCGLFDDQNGLYFEFDGNTVYACRRNATTQISGSCAATFRDSLLIGTNTRFTSQLVAGDRIVIKGQTYLVTQIDSDNNLYILPAYRGVSTSGIVVTKVIDTRVPQSEWNIDRCDGTGPSGFYLRPYRIQMAYMDYAWYGAGKVRFGFKDQNGIVRYAHEFVHNNHQTEAYLRSGNLPARYEIQNTGRPSYVPALAHWGTSVIMDGRFDPDNAYLFTASSNNVQLTGTPTLNVTARAETVGFYEVRVGTTWRTLGYALLVDTPSTVYNTLIAGQEITGANLSGAKTANPFNASFYGLPNQPYQVSLRTRLAGNSATDATRNLIMVSPAPTGTAGANSAYTVTLAASSTPVVYDIPLISIRLAPSVDTGTPGFLGEREIINRMQLILASVGISTTHTLQIKLRLNGLISTNNWERVQNPSLSQLLYHTNDDTIEGGVDIFTFRAQGSVGAADRTLNITAVDLGEVSVLGNAILGGDSTFPDGPDVLTVVAVLAEDPSTVSTTNPLTAVGRITWTESQA